MVMVDADTVKDTDRHAVRKLAIAMLMGLLLMVWLMVWSSACVDGCAPTIRVHAIVNGTETSLDDILVASPNAGGDGATVEVFLDGGDETELFATVAADAAHVEPASARVSTDRPGRFQVRAASPSAAEGSLVVELRVDGEDGPVVGEARLTAIGGVKIAFAGAFAFVTNNDNGARASSDGRPFTACNGDEDPLIRRATPLPCEAFTRINQVMIDDEQASARFDDTRPTLGLFVTELKTFSPVIDLAGRDSLLDVGTLVRAPADRTGDMATIYTDNCDTPGDGTDPALLDPGLEPFDRFALDVGDALSLGYHAETPSIARIWTRFPTPATPDEVAADLAAVDELLPDGATGCSSAGLSYFDVDGTFVCNGEQNVRQLLQRNAGFRSMIARASADFTSRQVVARADEQSPSLVARLFRDATGAAPAEAFLRLNGFDWYTLTAFVDRGVVSTPSGIDARFEQLLVEDGCPATREPVVPVSDDPFAIDP
jgi:hypothetical protein